MFITVLLIMLMALTITAFVLYKRSAKAYKKLDTEENYDYSSKDYRKRTTSIYRYTAIGLAVITALSLLGSVTTIVKPKTVGIPVAFGKPVGVYNNGLHMKAPWTHVETLDGSIQNDTYNGDNQIEVRLGNNSKATADASIQWQLKTDDATSLFLDYKSFDNIRTNLIDRNLKASMNEAMSEYNPLDSVKKSDSNNGSDLDKLSKEVQKKMEDRVGGKVDVKSITIPIVNFDQSTQDRINELQSEIARGRIAEQKKSTNKSEAEANRIIQESISDEVLTSKCLDIVDKSGQSPLGCFPGSNVSPVKNVGGDNK